MKYLLFLALFSCTTLALGQPRSQVEFGVSYAFNTSGDIPSIVVRNQFRHQLRERLHLLVEAHVLDGGFDWLGVNLYKGSKPFIFIDKYRGHPLGAAGPGSVEGIKSLKPKTNRSTFYTFDLDLGYEIIRKSTWSLIFAGGGTFVYANQSGIWEYGDGVLTTPFYGEVNVVYTAPGNYRYWDIGGNGQLDLDLYVGKVLTLGARIAVHATSKAGIFYIDYGIGIGARL